MACPCILPVYGTAGPVTRGELGDSGPDETPLLLGAEERKGKAKGLNLAIRGLHDIVPMFHTLTSAVPPIRSLVTSPLHSGHVIGYTRTFIF